MAFAGDHRPDPDLLNRALVELASGEPEWVLVDRRVLRVLMGPLADLIVQMPTGLAGPEYDPDEDGYIWDDDPLC